MPRQINAAGLALVKGFEGLRLLAYDDLDPDRVLQPGDKVRGTLTIGHGHTGPDVVIGKRITPEEAAALLEADLDEAEAGVAARVTVPLGDNEFAALVSLAYNIGLGNFGRSTLLRKLNAGDRLGAAAEFARWNKAGGKVLRGLVRRRAAEAELFTKPEAASAPATAQAQRPTETPDNVKAEPKKLTPFEMALAAAPAAGSFLGGVDWRLGLGLVLVGGAIAYLLMRRGRA